MTRYRGSLGASSAATVTTANPSTAGNPTPQLSFFASTDAGHHKEFNFASIALESDSEYDLVSDDDSSWDVLSEHETETKEHTGTLDPLSRAEAPVLEAPEKIPEPGLTDKRIHDDLAYYTLVPNGAQGAKNGKPANPTADSVGSEVYLDALEMDVEITRLTTPAECKFIFQLEEPKASEMDCGGVGYEDEEEPVKVAPITPDSHQRALQDMEKQKNADSDLKKRERALQQASCELDKREAALLQADIASEQRSSFLRRQLYELHELQQREKSVKAQLERQTCIEEDLKQREQAIETFCEINHAHANQKPEKQKRQFEKQKRQFEEQKCQFKKNKGKLEDKMCQFEEQERQFEEQKRQFEERKSEAEAEMQKAGSFRKWQEHLKCRETALGVRERMLRECEETISARSEQLRAEQLRESNRVAELEHENEKFRNRISEIVNILEKLVAEMKENTVSDFEPGCSCAGEDWYCEYCLDMLLTFPYDDNEEEEDGDKEERGKYSGFDERSEVEAELLKDIRSSKKRADLVRARRRFYSVGKDVRRGYLPSLATDHQDASKPSSIAPIVQPNPRKCSDGQLETCSAPTRSVATTTSEAEPHPKLHHTSSGTEAHKKTPKEQHGDRSWRAQIYNGVCASRKRKSKAKDSSVHTHARAEAKKCKYGRRNIQEEIKGGLELYESTGGRSITKMGVQGTRRDVRTLPYGPQRWASQCTYYLDYEWS